MFRHENEINVSRSRSESTVAMIEIFWSFVPENMLQSHKGKSTSAKMKTEILKKGLPVVEKFILRKLSICSFILLVTILTKQLLHTDYSDVNTISKVRLSRSVSTNVFTCFCCISHLQIWRIHHGICWNSHLCRCLSWKCYYTIYVVFPLQWQTEQETRDKRRTAFGGGQRCIAKSDPHLHD